MGMTPYVYVLGKLIDNVMHLLSDRTDDRNVYVCCEEQLLRFRRMDSTYSLYAVYIDGSMAGVHVNPGDPAAYQLGPELQDAIRKVKNSGESHWLKPSPKGLEPGDWGAVEEKRNQERRRVRDARRSKE